MFKISVARDVIEHAQRQVASHNFGQRSHGNGTLEQQLTGVIAENAVLRLLGLPLNDGGNGCDDGVDCRFAGVSLDIKAMGRTTDVRTDFVNNFLAAQLSFAVDALLFCSLHKTRNELTICGWIPKAKFIERARLFPKGSIRKRSDGSEFATFADLYEIGCGDLSDVSSPWNLREQLVDFGLSEKKCV